MALAWPIFQVFVIFDTTQGVSSSVIRGTGQQRIGSWITLSAYWVFGIPIALLCVFTFDYGIRGLWAGPTVAVFYNTACYTFLINRINWEKLIEDSRKKRLADKGKKAVQEQKAKEQEPKDDKEQIPVQTITPQPK